MADSKSLTGRLEAACAGRWRNNPSARSQAAIAVRAVARGYPQFNAPEDVPDFIVSAAVADWYIQGVTPATINKRLSCLKALGVTIPGMERVPRQLKWWLNPQDRERLLRWLDGNEEFRTMAAYVRWATITGLRVEESLRLTWSDIHGQKGAYSITVPGLKTLGSQASLPLPNAAHEVIWALNNRTIYPHRTGVFQVSYDTLHEQWQLCRKFLGVMDNPTSTLKALRRTAARYLHVDLGMPLDMVRQYLRHEDIETTMGYLRLTGGYGTEEMRRWVK